MAPPALKDLVRDVSICPNDVSPAIADVIQKAVTRAIASQSQHTASDKFVLENKFGVLLWNVMASFLFLAVCKVCTSIRQIQHVRERLRRILHCGSVARGPLLPIVDADVSEGARAATSPGATDITPVEVERREEASSMRKRWLADFDNDVQPSCEAPPVGCSTEPSAGHSPSTAPGSSTLQDTLNPPLTVIAGFPYTTLTTDAEEQQLATSVHKHLPTDTLRVRSGSTFVSATVAAGACGAEELLKRAESLIKDVGFYYGSVCTVQLGSAAFLYGTKQDGKVEHILLTEGLYDVPIITSAKGFEKRTIVIKGLYLDNTEIKATTGSYGDRMSLCVLDYQKLDNMEILLAQLPEGKTLDKQLFVHAKKTITLEGHTTGLDLRSNEEEVVITAQKAIAHATGILGSKLLWIWLLVLYTYQVVIVHPWQFFHVESILPFIIWPLCYFVIEYTISPWIYNTIVRCFELIMRVEHLERILTPTYLADNNLLRIENVEDSTTRKSLKKEVVSTTLTKSDEDETDDDELVAELDEKDDPNWKWHKVTRETQSDEVLVSPFSVETHVMRDGQKNVRLFVHSPQLIQLLNDLYPKAGTRFAIGSAIDPREIFLLMGNLKVYVEKPDQVDPAEAAATDDCTIPSGSHTTLWSVKHLLRFVEGHFADELVQYERMKAEECVSFEMLWAFFVPGEEVRRLCDVTNQECFATVNRRATYHKGADGVEYCFLELDVMDFNVQSYGKCTMTYKIPTFDGELPFTSLRVCPLRFFSNRQKMEDRFVKMGICFYEAAMQQPFRYMQFKGSINVYAWDGKCWKLHKHNADGRVMVDLYSFARMNPDYAPLKNAEPPCDVMTGSGRPTGEIKRPSDEELKFAPAFAYGFSFRLKKWGCFEVCGLGEISFNVNAFDELTMQDPSEKKVLWDLAQPYLAKGVVARSSQTVQSIDPIANKGTGCIVLCHGPPGTGKTLTAEALAETMQCALWSISAFELGESAKDVEAKLWQIMEIAHSWGAVLLLDEADAYLQRREAEGVDVERNLLTGVFLRVLEYCRGVMFLTTNRVSVFDYAIVSRISLLIFYPPLDETQRFEIWRNLLERAGIRNVTLEALTHHEFNGRQIRNIVHLAQLLAYGSGQTPNINHVIKAIESHVASSKQLPGLLPAAS